MAATETQEVQIEAQQAQAQPQQQATVKKASAAKRRPSKKKVIIASASRKTARARARLVQGTGRITINGKNAETISNKYMRELVLEPIKLSRITAELAKNADISVKVIGGGTSGQLQAARSAIAKVIALASKDEVVKKLYMNYDRSLLVDDVRQVEPKKFKGPKARARFQKSYR
ncbi:MAG: 30S ribosomal protein S9 [Candidatus Micrarchaeia archaeon]